MICDVIEELGKVVYILKIKKLSYLFHKTKNNSKIYRKDIDPEDVLAYFIQNIKSDYYRASKGFIESDISRMKILLIRKILRKIRTTKIKIIKLCLMILKMLILKRLF